MTVAHKCVSVLIRQPVSYHAAVRLMSRLVRLRHDNSIGDTLMLLEHEPVITLGRSAKPDHVLKTPTELSQMGIERHSSTRGGDVTYHGPGQLVFYPVLKLERENADVRRYVNMLEEAAMRTASDFGIHAFRMKGAPGVWTHHGKLAAIGVRIQRWITSHGLSLNVGIDLAAYSTIVPCGLAGEKVTSMRAILGNTCPSIRDTAEHLLAHFASLYGLRADLQTVNALQDFVPLAIPGNSP